jgi:Iap family predicted aminopeptidase
MIVEPSVIREDVVRLSKELYNGVEVVAGSFDEIREVERLKGVIESYVEGRVRVLDVPLLSWRLKGLTLDPNPEVLAVAPYVESASVKAPWFRVEGDPTKHVSWRGFPEGRVAIAREPANPDDIKVAALHASEAGALALIVESPSAPRKIVTNGYWGYNYRVGAPTPIPVLVVEEGYSSKLSSHTLVSVEVEATTIESTGYTLQLDLPGSSEEIVIVGAHHDRWYGGFLDDIMGIAQATVAARILHGLGFTTRLVVFTAEEHGAPGYASWYWAWGSRFYVDQLHMSGLVENIRLFVNFDMAAIEPLKVSGSPQYSLLAEGVDNRCCECPECDSFSLAVRGVPTICIHSLWSRDVRALYHTPRDTPDVANLDVAVKAVNLAIESAVKGPSWSHLEHLLTQILGGGPLEARRALYTINAISRRAGWDRLYRSLARIALKPVHYGSYKLDEAELEALWFPEVQVYLRLLKDVDAGRAPHEAWIAGDERILYVIKGAGGRMASRVELARQFKYNMDTLWDQIEEIQRELLR